MNFTFIMMHFAATFLFFLFVTEARQHVPVRKRILLVGVTGNGKSTLGNALLGSDAFQVGHSLDSCTNQTTLQDGFLFGESTLPVAVYDTGGLGDTEGRDEKFADDVAAHSRSEGGHHGIVYVHNACQRRLDAQTRRALMAMVVTLADETGRPEISRRLSVVMTQCTDIASRRAYMQMLPPIMCNEYNLCNVPIYWYDDHSPQDASGDSASLWWEVSKWVQSLLTPDASDDLWRDLFSEWVERLPIQPLNVPDETEREELKKLHRERIERLEKETRETKERMEQLLNELKTFRKENARGKRKEEMLLKEIRDLKTELENLNKNSLRGCFSGSSLVVDEDQGFVAMKDLKIGSRVATNNGWSTVTTFLHWHPNEIVSAVTIFHDHGTLTLSPQHMIFVIGDNGESKAVPAEQLYPGALLLTRTKDDPSRVQSVELNLMQGYYAPITASGTILVDNVIASCYTQDGYYNLSHSVIHILTAPIRSLPLWLSHMPAAGDVHPFARYPKAIMDSIISKFS